MGLFESRFKKFGREGGPNGSSPFHSDRENEVVDGGGKV